MTNSYLVQDGTDIKKYGVLVSEENITPPMTSNTSPSPYNVGQDASSTWGAPYDSWNAFNIEDHPTMMKTTTGWLTLDFGVAKTVSKYTLTSPTSYYRSDNRDPKNWQIEGSNDNSSWSVIDTQTNQTGWVASEQREYLIQTPASYRYYKFNMTSNNGDVYSNIGLIQYIGQLEDYAWQNVGTAPATKAMFDTGGMTDLSAIDNAALQLLAYASPELLCWTDETGSPVRTEKTTYASPKWLPISTNLPTPVVFQSNGMDIATLLQASFNLVPSDFDLVTWTNVLDKAESAYVTATPKGQLILGEYDFSSLMDLTVTATATSDVNLRLIASGDSGATWKTYNNGWQPITSDASQVSSNGMTLTRVNGLVEADWDALGSTIRLGYFIANDSVLDSLTYQKKPVSTETPTLDSVKITYDELTIEGRMKDLEQINAINMAKLQFKSNSLLQSDKYELHDMVIDTFETGTNIDTTSAVYDATNKEFAYDPSVSAPAVQEVILPAEVMPSYRKKFMLNADHAGNISYEYSLDGGTTWNTITPFTIIDLTGQVGINLKVKAKLKDSTAKLRGIAFSWA
jgi:hypothetical protein